MRLFEPERTDQPETSTIRLRALSLEAGVQSTTMARMAADGETGPMPDYAIFVDAGWQPGAVYDHLKWLMSPNVRPFPVHIVSAGNIREQLLRPNQGNRRASIPAFARTVTPAGAKVPVFGEDDDRILVEIASQRTTAETVAFGMIRRQCTTDFKIFPIRRKVRELAGRTRKRSPPSPLTEALHRYFDRRDHARQAEFRSLADQAISVDRKADEPPG